MNNRLHIVGAIQYLNEIIAPRPMTPDNIKILNESLKHLIGFIPIVLLNIWQQYIVPNIDDVAAPQAKPTIPPQKEMKIILNVNGCVTADILRNIPGYPLAISNRPFIDVI